MRPETAGESTDLRTVGDDAYEGADDDDPLLTITPHSSGQEVRVEVSGELDLNTVPQLQQALETAYTPDPAPEQLILDFRHLEFIDSAGLALLIDWQRRLGNSVSSLTLRVSRGGQVCDVLALSRFDHFFHIEYSD